MVKARPITHQPLRSDRIWPLVHPQDPLKYIKLGIWAYFLLIIFEGALRKWFLPSLSTPLLVIRDPIAAWLIYQTWRKGLLPQTPYLFIVVLVGVLSFYTALFLGHGSLPVAVYGSRILLIHFPLMFVMGAVLKREDVIRIGKVTLLISIPMVVLIALQFYSPQSAWVNLGVGGDESGAGFSGAMGFFRPPGTFSFTIGNSMFYSYVACFVFYFWLRRENIHVILLLSASLALILSIPLSISRSLLFQVVITLLFTFGVLSKKPQMLGQMLIAFAGLAIVLVIASNLPFTQIAVEAFTTRFTSASKAEGGLEGTLIDRVLGGLIGAIVAGNHIPFFGYGTGMGTNVGAVLLTGERGFLLAEGEWGRLIGELGLVFGLLIIIARIGLVIKISWNAFQRLAINDPLPWLLLSFGAPTLLLAQWAQPTVLGFSTLIGGLMIASFNRQSEKI